MTAVVLVGEFPSTGIITDPLAVRVADSSAPENSLHFLDLMAHGLGRSGAVLVLYPAWRQEAAVRLVRTARGILGTDRVAGVALDLPPLALSMVSDQLAFIAPHVRPGMLASLAPVLASRVYAGAWLSSVAKLENIRAGLGQHLFSYMPGSGFMVTASPVPAVHRITSSAPVARSAFRPLEPVLVLAAYENGDAKWVRDHLGPSLRAASMTFLSPPPLGTYYWATKKYAEFVAFSGHPQDLQQAVQSTPCTPCPWCEEPTAQPTCAFCGRVQPQNAQPTHPQPPQNAQSTPAAQPPQPTHTQPPQPTHPELPQNAQPTHPQPQPTQNAHANRWPGPSDTPVAGQAAAPSAQVQGQTAPAMAQPPRTHAKQPAEPVLSASPPDSVVFPAQPAPSSPQTITPSSPRTIPDRRAGKAPEHQPPNLVQRAGRPGIDQPEIDAGPGPAHPEHNGHAVRSTASDDREEDDWDEDEGRPGTVVFRPERRR